MTPTLPVWTIRPNWKGGILERLEWLTDVLASSTGAEQRRSNRLSPRRSVEITVNPTNNERTYLDLLLHKLGSEEWLFPLWFDKAKLAVAVEAGDERVEFDNTYRDYVTGGLAIIHKDAFTWEVISIAAQDDNGLDLDVPLDADWAKGCAIYPLRRARLPQATDMRALSSRVGESVLLFTMTEPNDWPAVMPDDLIFEGMPVITTAPNRSEAITTQHTRLSTDLDNRIGLPRRVDDVGRAFQVQSHSWMRVGRQAQAEFRSMLYWLNGRQKAVWLPSFNHDIIASRASTLGSTNLDVQKIGIAYAGGVIPGREVIRIGGIPARITALGAPQSPQEERLRIGAGLLAAVAKGTPGSFMSPARLNQDAIEILHHADTNGVMECSTTFKTFANTRNAAGGIHMPIPLTEKNGLACGYVGFSGLSWVIPCLNGAAVCPCVNVVQQEYVVNGKPGVIYTVRLRVRSIAETKIYAGGEATNSPYAKKNPTINTGNVNEYRLHVSNPPAVYVLNNDPFTGVVKMLDYTVDIQVAAGATLLLYATALDGAQHNNMVPLSVPDNDPLNPVIVTQPFLGQFMQIDGVVP